MEDHHPLHSGSEVVVLPPFPGKLEPDGEQLRTEAKEQVADGANERYGVAKSKDINPNHLGEEIEDDGDDETREPSDDPPPAGDSTIEVEEAGSDCEEEYSRNVEENQAML